MRLVHVGCEQIGVNQAVLHSGGEQELDRDFLPRWDSAAGLLSVQGCQGAICLRNDVRADERASEISARTAQPSRLPQAGAHGVERVGPR